MICGLGYADYILTCHDVVRWARGERITCTGRGSAADSCVAYCLYLTNVDVIERGLPFARFLSPGKVPDVDLDFPSHRRDDVYRQRSADVRRGGAWVLPVRSPPTRPGRAFAMPGRLWGCPMTCWVPFAGALNHGLHAGSIEAAFAEDGAAELRGHEHLIPRFKQLFDLCGRIATLPRHISSHPSGVVIARCPAPPARTPHSVGAGRPAHPHARQGRLRGRGRRQSSICSRCASTRQRKTRKTTFRTGGRRRRENRGHALTFRATIRRRSTCCGRGVRSGYFNSSRPRKWPSRRKCSRARRRDLTHAVAMIRPANNRSGAKVLNTVRKYLDARLGYSPIVYAHPCPARRSRSHLRVRHLSGAG